MDEILGYLLNDLAALKAYSLTYRQLFGATRPLIHKWLCLAPRQNRKAHPKPKGSLFGRRKRAPEEFERLIGADRWGILCYTQNLTFEMGGDSSRPRNAQEYLPHLRSITELRTQARSHHPSRPPVYSGFRCHEYFGIFTNTLRHFDVRNAHDTTAQRLLYVVCQFPLLEDPSIMSPDKAVMYLGSPFQRLRSHRPSG